MQLGSGFDTERRFIAIDAARHTIYESMTSLYLIATCTRCLGPPRKQTSTIDNHGRSSVDGVRPHADRGLMQRFRDRVLRVLTGARAQRLLFRVEGPRGSVFLSGRRYAEVATAIQEGVIGTWGMPGSLPTFKGQLLAGYAPNLHLLMADEPALAAMSNPHYADAVIIHEATHVLYHREIGLPPTLFDEVVAYIAMLAFACMGESDPDFRTAKLKEFMPGVSDLFLYALGVVVSHHQLHTGAFAVVGPEDVKRLENALEMMDYPYPKGGGPAGWHCGFSCRLLRKVISGSGPDFSVD